FQGEDGIRDPLVTGVQTCALPISIGLTNVKTSQLIGIGFDTFPYSYSETKPSFGGGVGITIALGPMNLFVEGRVIVVNTAGQSTTFAPLTIGMAFGGK